MYLAQWTISVLLVTVPMCHIKVLYRQPVLRSHFLMSFFPMCYIDVLLLSPISVCGMFVPSQYTMPVSSSYFHMLDVSFQLYHVDHPNQPNWYFILFHHVFHNSVLAIATCQTDTCPSVLSKNATLVSYARSNVPSRHSITLDKCPIPISWPFVQLQSAMAISLP